MVSHGGLRMKKFKNKKGKSFSLHIGFYLINLKTMRLQTSGRSIMTRQHQATHVSRKRTLAMLHY